MAGSSWTNQVVNQLIISGANGGEFVYDAAGNLRSANVGATTTDPVQHITCQQGFSTFNGFGAYLSLLSTSAAAPGFFQYVDNNNASQGALAYSFAGRGVTEPVTSIAVPQGEKIWNGTLFITGTPTTNVGSIGVGSVAWTGYLRFLLANGYQFDNTIAAGGGIASVNGASLETWHSLGTLAGYTVTRGRYRLSPQNNELELDISVTGGGANAASVTFSTTLAAPYLPLASYTQPLQTNLAIASWTAGQPRVGITAGGAVSVVFQINHTAAVVGQCFVPTD